MLIHIITQTVSTGTTAVGRVVSYDSNTGVLKYWQDRTMSLDLIQLEQHKLIQHMDMNLTRIY